jgi:hypothetical protein
MKAKVILALLASVSAIHKNDQMVAVEQEVNTSSKLFA